MRHHIPMARTSRWTGGITEYRSPGARPRRLGPIPYTDHHGTADHPMNPCGDTQEPVVLFIYRASPTSIPGSRARTGGGVNEYRLVFPAAWTNCVGIALQ